jgi:hypothetical protein
MDESERRASRAAWPVRRYRLGEEPPDTYPASLSPEERVLLVGVLSARVAEFTPNAPDAPPYTRATMPIRVIRPT